MNKSIVVALAKIFVAGAWVSGEPDKEKLSKLREELNRAANWTKEDWAGVDIYSHSSIKIKELVQLLDVLRKSIKDNYDKEYAQKTMKKCMSAMLGTVSEEELGGKELQLVRVVSDAILNVSSGVERKLENFFEKHSSKSETSKLPTRERNVHDLVDNPILYHSLQSITQRGVALHMNKSELEMLCVAGALMAVIAQADGEIHPEEVSIIKEAIQHNWEVSEDAADIIAEIAVYTEVTGMDILQNCKKLYAETTPDDRLHFMEALVEVIKSDNDVDANELARLREIGTNLRVPPDELMEMIPPIGAVEVTEEEEEEEEEEETEEEEEEETEEEGDI